MNIKNLLITAGEDVLAKIENLLKEGEQAAVAKLKQLAVATPR